MIPHSTHETNCSPATLCLREESEGIAGCLHNILILKHEGVVYVSISVNTPMLNGPGLSFHFWLQCFSVCVDGGSWSTGYYPF